MTHVLAHLTSPEIESIDKTDAVAVQPIGAVEQHGPHMPVITDALTAERLSDRAIAGLPDDSNLWLLPTLSYGRSVEHLGWPGTIALTTETLLAVCRDLGRSLAAFGFRKLAFINGHGGQPALLETVARDIRIETGLEVFSLMPQRLDLGDDLDLVEGTYDVHGGQHETSIVLSLAPELVHMDRAVHDGRAAAGLFDETEHLTLEGKLSTAWVTDDLSTTGVLGDATAATRALGDALVARQVAALGRALLEVRAFAFPEKAGR